MVPRWYLGCLVVLSTAIHQYCIPGLYKPGIAELAEARGDQLSFAPHYRPFQP